MKIYIAGPMTGLPEFNYPVFHQVAATLRAAGYDVINPAENPKPRCGTWQGYMRMSVAQVASVDCLVMLPGWDHSRGAKIEHALATDLGLKIFTINLQTETPGGKLANTTAPTRMNPE